MYAELKVRAERRQHSLADEVGALLAAALSDGGCATAAAAAATAHR